MLYGRLEYFTWPQAKVNIHYQGSILSTFHKERLNIYFITYAKFIQLCKLTSTSKQRHFGILDNSGPIPVELTYSSIIANVILRNAKQKKTRKLTLKIVNETVTKHFTVQIIIRLTVGTDMYNDELTWVIEYNEVTVSIYPSFK